MIRIFALCIIFCPLVTQAQTSKDTQKLQAAFERYPQADANGDGVLTLEEAKAFKRKIEAQTPDQKDDKGGGIRNSYTYKTVGNHTLELYVDTASSIKTSIQH